MNKVTFSFKLTPIIKKTTPKVVTEAKDIEGIIIRKNNEFLFLKDNTKLIFPITEKSFDTTNLKEFYILLPDNTFIKRIVTSNYYTPNAKHYLPFRERSRVSGKLVTINNVTYFDFKSITGSIDKINYSVLINGL